MSNFENQNQAVAKLLKYVLEQYPKPNLAGFAADADLRLNTLSNWINGKHRPTLEMALKIERITGGAVPAHDWGCDDEEK